MAEFDTAVDDVTDPATRGEATTGFEPDPEPDDWYFAVVDSDVLREWVAVFEPVEANAHVFVLEGTGLRAHGRTEGCYVVEVEIPVETFEVFRVEDIRLGVDTAALGAALDRFRRGETVAIHGKRDGTMRLRGENDAVDVGGEFPEHEANAGLLDMMCSSYSAEFTVAAGRLQALVEADSDSVLVQLATDEDQQTVRVGFLDHPTDDPRVELALGAADLTTPPTHDDGENPKSTVFCRESIEPALGPLRGTVTVRYSPARLLTTNLIYHRADADVRVRTGLHGPGIEDYDDD